MVKFRNFLCAIFCAMLLCSAPYSADGANFASNSPSKISKADSADVNLNVSAQANARVSADPGKISKQNFKSDFIWGVTIDDGWYEDAQDASGAKLQSIVRALQALPAKPTVRVVMSKEISPREYEPLFRRLSEVSYVMACPVDSYEMSSYKSVKSYEKRFADAFAALAPYVQIWEIGNEINGEGWLGDDANFIAAKMIAAFELIHKKGAKTALTAYYTPSGAQKTQMREWLQKFVPQDMKEGLDYLFVSYYEDDNEGFAPDWSEIFTDLQSTFPASKLGIGECGNTASGATQASKKAMMRRYYTMPRYAKNYVGGYFWWYFVQDCVSGAGPGASNGRNRGARDKAKAADELLKSLSEVIGEAYR